MNDLTPAALAVFACTHGMATGTMLQRAGVSRNRRGRLLEEGLLEQAHERVYRLAGGPTSTSRRRTDRTSGRSTASDSARPRASRTTTYSDAAMASSWRAHLASPSISRAICPTSTTHQWWSRSWPNGDARWPPSGGSARRSCILAGGVRCSTWPPWHRESQAVRWRAIPR